MGSLSIVFFMHRLRPSKPIPYLFANKNSLASVCPVSSVAKRPFTGITPTIVSSSWFGISQGPNSRIPSLIRNMSASASSVSVEKETILENGVELLSAVADLYGGVTVNMEQPMDSKAFVPRLRASILQWRQQGKRGVWIKLPLELANLVEAAVKEGFRYHHAESDYLMLVNWISITANTLPANASHRVGIGAFVMNSKREVLVVQENSGPFRGKNVWKLPTGVVNEGEDICTAAIREVKEETGIETKFVEVLAFRQSHNSFFKKSDLFFVCMLEPCSTDIQKQDSEIEAAQWMSVEDYAAQSFNRENEIFNYIAQVCLTKSEKDYSGFSPVSTTTASGKASYLYCNTKDWNQLLTSGNQQHKGDGVRNENKN